MLECSSMTEMYSPIYIGYIGFHIKEGNFLCFILDKYRRVKPVKCQTIQPSQGIAWAEGSVVFDYFQKPTSYVYKIVYKIFLKYYAMVTLN